MGYEDSVRRLLAPALAFAIVLALLLLAPHPARAFGDIGAFDPRVLLTGATTTAARTSAPGRWSWELIQRTSAPARLRPSTVRADYAQVRAGGSFAARMHNALYAIIRYIHGDAVPATREELTPAQRAATPTRSTT